MEKAVVNPYRGTEDHGVPSHDPYLRPAEYGEVEGAEWTQEVEPPTPVPVYLVNKDAPEYRSFETFHDIVQLGETKMILRRDMTRTAARLTNLVGVTNPVYIGQTQNSSLSMHGYLLKNNELPMSTQQEVWCTNPASNSGSAEICIYIENSVVMP
jgi:hypothetical protein